MNRIGNHFLALQHRLEAELQLDRQAVDHPGAKGEASELSWAGMLQKHLPVRYQVGKGFVFDSSGTPSRQIDLIIYDNQYTPLLLNQEHQRIVPAESVYAVFEVKQELDRGNLRYAGESVASVRGLSRTSAPIVHAGGEFKPRKLFPILGGILALESGWKPAIGEPLERTLAELPEAQRLDLGCAVRHGSFEAAYLDGGEVRVRTSRPSAALLHFFFQLVARLQALGTAPAIDYSCYADLVGAGD